MSENIIGVRFRQTGKLCYMDPWNFSFKIGDNVIAESERGVEMARIVSLKKKADMPELEKADKIIRPANKDDMLKDKENKELANDAIIKCKKHVKDLKLNMKLISAEYIFDGSKLIFYFVSEERVDFRELVRILAAEYKVRIEMRQVGARDEVKMHPNLGICGREVCCRTFLPDFETVTIKMAKEQGLQINMPKISGSCGRLMCCLKYEEDIYKENAKEMPKYGEIVKYLDQEVKVVGLDILNKKVKIRVGDEESSRIEVVEVDKIERLNRNKKDNKKGSE